MVSYLEPIINIPSSMMHLQGFVENVARHKLKREESVPTYIHVKLKQTTPICMDINALGVTVCT